MAWKSTRPSLLERVRDPADGAAWRAFDARYGEPIVRYLQARGLQRADAEDLRQQVLVSLLSALRRFEYRPERGKFRGYLGRITRNALSRHLGRPNPGARDLEDVVEPKDDEPDDPEWEREWTAHHLRRAMRVVRSSFDARNVAAFDRLLAGASLEEVAADSGLTKETLQKVKQRIRDRLRELIERQVAEEDGLVG